MFRESVESSAVSSIGYDADLQILEIEFTSGNVYVYYEIPKILAIEFMEAESKGTFYNQNIRGLHESYKMVVAP